MRMEQRTVNKHTIRQALKPDERIVCENATVIMDGQENLSYFNNDGAICLMNSSENVLIFAPKEV